MDEHWHSGPDVGPYRCVGCNGTRVVLTEAQVIDLQRGVPARVTRQQWQDVIDRRAS